MFIYFKGPDSNLILTADDIKGMHLMESDSKSICEPDLVNQVFSICKLPIVKNGEEVFSIKTCMFAYTAFLACGIDPFV